MAFALTQNAHHDLNGWWVILCRSTSSGVGNDLTCMVLNFISSSLPSTPQTDPGHSAHPWQGSQNQFGSLHGWQIMNWTSSPRSSSCSCSCDLLVVSWNLETTSLLPAVATTISTLLLLLGSWMWSFSFSSISSFSFSSSSQPTSHRRISNRFS